MCDAEPLGDSTRRVSTAHVQAELQALGAMLAPVVFHAPGHPDFAPMQVAPWAGELGADAWPGVLRRLRGDWPCVPFGTTERPAGLGPGWAAREPGDSHGHGYGANHAWEWLDEEAARREADAHAAAAGPALAALGAAEVDGPVLALAIDYPGDSAVLRLTRCVRLSTREPLLLQTLRVQVRAACRLPVALHPTFRLDGGTIRLRMPAYAGAVAYPVPAEPGTSRLVPGAGWADLSITPLAGGGTVDLTHFPLPCDTEELLQVRDVRGALQLDHLARGWRVGLDWDHAALPDAMLWISHRGRRHAPWSGRHLALGLEPVNAVFDLARVATPPPGHTLAHRTGVAFEPGWGRVIASTLRAAPLLTRP